MPEISSFVQKEVISRIKVKNYNIIFLHWNFLTLNGVLGIYKSIAPATHFDKFHSGLFF